MVVRKQVAKVAKKPVVKKKPLVRKPARTVAAKAVKKGAAKPKVAAAKPVKKPKKEKVMRDSFSMPKSDFEKIAELKALCSKLGMHVKKSELLRAGLHALGKMSSVQLKQALAGLEVVKTGRPKKS